MALHRRNQTGKALPAEQRDKEETKGKGCSKDKHTTSTKEKTPLSPETHPNKSSSFPPSSSSTRDSRFCAKSDRRFLLDKLLSTKGRRASQLHLLSARQRAARKAKSKDEKNKPARENESRSCGREEVEKEEDEEEEEEGGKKKTKKWNGGGVSPFRASLQVADWQNDERFARIFTDDNFAVGGGGTGKIDKFGRRLDNKKQASETKKKKNKQNQQEGKKKKKMEGKVSETEKETAGEEDEDDEKTKALGNKRREKEVAKKRKKGGSKSRAVEEEVGDEDENEEEEEEVGRDGADDVGGSFIDSEDENEEEDEEEEEVERDRDSTETSSTSSDSEEDEEEEEGPSVWDQDAEGLLMVSLLKRSSRAWFHLYRHPYEDGYGAPDFFLLILTLMRVVWACVFLHIWFFLHGSVKRAPA